MHPQATEPMQFDSASPNKSTTSPAMIPLDVYQMDQLKNQIMAFKLLSRNLEVPSHLMQRTLENYPKTANGVVINGNAKTDEGKCVNGYAMVDDAQLPISIPDRFVPKSMDPVMLVRERERQATAQIDYRLKELRAMPSNLSNDPVYVESENIIPATGSKIRALLELKALHLVDKQRKLRDEILNGVNKNTTMQTSVDRIKYRREKKYILRDARITERMERQQRLERERREKQRHLDQLARIIQHARDMQQAHRQHQAKMSRLGRAVINYHAHVEKEEEKRSMRTQEERLRALRNNDEEAYLKLIDRTKDTRINQLLEQTDHYLDSLSQAVLAQQNDGIHYENSYEMHVQDSDDIIHEGADSSYGKEDDEGGKKLDYYSIAHRIMEPVTSQPSILVGGTLKEYQIKGLQWMVSLYNNRLNGILADEMGLGKTIQTISLVTFLIEKKKQNGPFLIIVPLSTITNWTLEFEKWAPSVSKVVYKGTPSVRKWIQQTEIKHGNFQVLLTTYEYIIKDRPCLAKIKWLYLIVDEGHRMKNVNSKLSTVLAQYYSMRYRIILTGTPLQNNLPELWALLNFILPKVFNSVQSFDEWFNKPFANSSETKMELNEEEKLLIIRRLHKVLRPFLLRRLKKDVEAELPDKVERVIKCKFSALQTKLYQQMKKHGALYMTNEKGRTNIKGLNNTIMQLRKICNHPFVFDYVEDAVNPARLSNELLYRVSGKFELLDRILPKLKITGHRVLIFFQMTQIMNIMEDYLNWKGMRYLRLDGSTKAEDRSSLLKLFNDPGSDYFVFLLSTRAGGLGLNLQTADTVVIFDSDWNPHQDLQAQDRAHRIGQTKEVRIFRLITEKSVEETILARAQYKLDLDGKIIQAGKFDNKSTAEEREAFLRSLLEADNEETNDFDDDLTDEDLNDMVARDDEELDLFRRMDDERRKQEEQIRKQRGLKRFERLMQMEELPEIFQKEDDALLIEQREIEYGRGHRQKSDVRYDDGLTEQQWLNALENDKMDFFEAVSLTQERKKKRQEKKRRRIARDEEDEDEEEEEMPRKKRNRREGSIASTAGSMDGSMDETIKTPARRRGRPSRVNGVNTDTPGSGQTPLNKRRRMRSEQPDQAEEKLPEVDMLPPHLRKKMTEAFEECYNAVLECKDESDGHSRSELFHELPDQREYPSYYLVIQTPIALSTIWRRIHSPYYTNPEHFRADFRQMFENARTFNEEGSWVYVDAVEMERVFDRKFEEAIQKIPKVDASEILKSPTVDETPQQPNTSA
ncbi:uncharacterized protein VTP21DRAFT_8684 [Calcarisporiella thermophila]|uniref:uncharacterized protein n=1 Tax=Calcarisporiella thermophila TaxID=911321 RepID=UPI0037444023